MIRLTRTAFTMSAKATMTAKKPVKGLRGLRGFALFVMVAVTVQVSGSSA
jgi:hypothetical protein